jgi:hypothetical protein
MRGRRITDAELDRMGAEPGTGEVWWCNGDSLGFADGGKVRPVLILEITDDRALIIPLTTKKPVQNQIPVAHAAGTSWLTHKQILVPRLALISSLGPWANFAQWRAKGCP